MRKCNVYGSTDTLLVDNDKNNRGHALADSMINVDRLAAVIQLVDGSAMMQGISLSVMDKSEIIATLYVEAAQEQVLPDDLRTDRLVWMAGA